MRNATIACPKPLQKKRTYKNSKSLARIDENAAIDLQLIGEALIEDVETQIIAFDNLLKLAIAARNDMARRRQQLRESSARLNRVAA
jgi:hypothetical protein